MTWSYDAEFLSDPKNQIRLLIGDTNPECGLLQNEEISYFLSQRPSFYGAAAECCRSLATRFSAQATMSAGDTKEMLSDISKAFAQRALAFETKAVVSGSGAPYAGGISVSDKETQDEDTDRVQPQFVLGADDNYLPVAPSSDSPPSEQPD